MSARRQQQDSRNARLAGCSLLLMLIGAVTMGCAAPSAPAGPVPQVAGSWEGQINPMGEMLGQQSLPAGFARLRLTQRGTWVDGALTGPGFSGAISGTLHGNRLNGSFDGHTLGGVAMEVSATFDGTFKGDAFRGILDQNGRLTLKRLP
jgi:hypothetical protein